MGQGFTDINKDTITKENHIKLVGPVHAAEGVKVQCTLYNQVLHTQYSTLAFLQHAI